MLTLIVETLFTLLEIAVALAALIAGLGMDDF